MTALEEAQMLFRKEGLAFPTLPEKLAARLEKKDEWLFSTREIRVSPYNLDYYLNEVERSRVGDNALLCHSGHGVNSYALQYYLVYGSLRLFLHMGWGGVYMDSQAAAAEIEKCFSLADEITEAVEGNGKLSARDPLTIVGSDFYGSFWLALGESRPKEAPRQEDPATVLTEVRHWLTHLK